MGVLVVGNGEGRKGKGDGTYELDGALGEFGAPFARRGWRLEVAAVGPPADGEQHLEVAIAALEQVELLQAAVQVRARVVPAVAVPVDVGVGPRVREVYLA